MVMRRRKRQDRRLSGSDLAEPESVGIGLLLYTATSPCLRIFVSVLARQYAGRRGILLLPLLTGMETDLSVVRRSRRSVVFSSTSHALSRRALSVAARCTGVSIAPCERTANAANSIY